MRPEIGMILYGYCGGAFGRDGYNDKRIEGIGVDWIVARDTSGIIYTATFRNIDHRNERVAEWSAEPIGE